MIVNSVNAQIFNPTVELVIPKEKQLRKQMQKSQHIHWQQKRKQENALSNLKSYTLFYAFCSSDHYVFDNFLFHLIFLPCLYLNFIYIYILYIYKYIYIYIYIQGSYVYIYTYIYIYVYIYMYIYIYLYIYIYIYIVLSFFW